MPPPAHQLDEHKHDENCQEIFARLSEYLDRELSPETCEQIEAHIADCGPCVEFTESLRKTVDLCRQYKPADLPPPLGEEARARLQEAWRACQTTLARGDGPLELVR